MKVWLPKGNHLHCSKQKSQQSAVCLQFSMSPTIYPKSLITNIKLKNSNFGGKIRAGTSSMNLVHIRQILRACNFKCLKKWTNIFSEESFHFWFLEFAVLAILAVGNTNFTYIATNLTLSCQIWLYQVWVLLSHSPSVEHPNYIEQISKLQPHRQHSTNFWIGCPQIRPQAGNLQIYCTLWWLRSAIQHNCKAEK